MSFGYIYIVENLVNGKSYIGQTRNLKERESAHLGGWSSPPVISAAVRKYGKENFDFVIIESCVSLEELNSREIYWIKELDCLTPKGYNLKRGGECGGELSETTKKKISISRKGQNCGASNHMFGRTLTDEHKMKISKANKGKSIGNKNPLFGKIGLEHPRYGKCNTDEWKKMMSARMSGENNPSYGKKGQDAPHFGKKHSEETRKRISGAQKKRWQEGKYANRSK